MRAMSDFKPWAPTNSPPVSPDPATVVDLVASLVKSEWPTTDEDRQRWFRKFGLLEAPDGADWDSTTQPGDTPTDWNTFEGEFVGVNWFIWTGWSREAVAASAAQLKEGLSAAFGPPSEELEPRVVGWTSLWTSGGRVIDMYFHTGVAPYARLDSAAVVQLHVDHEQRAEAQESAARTEQPPTTISSQKPSAE